MSQPLTKRQHDVMATVARLERERGYTPSVREIARELRVSAATVQEHLVALERKGYVSRSGLAFGLRVLTPIAEAVADQDVVHVDVLGTIAAGEPIEAIQQSDESIPVPRRLVTGECFFLRVRGDSMKDDYILDGDLVLVRRQDSVNNGEIAVALLPDGTATLKRVYREGRRLRLQTANSALQPKYVRSVEIQGKVVSVQRTFG
jgi:repressor LexA